VPLPPESIRAGKCYLTRIGQVSRVLQLLPYGYLRYEFRPGAEVRASGWTKARTDLQSFSYLVEREVSCDWTLKGDG
jgi:hypothetical protein